MQATIKIYLQSEYDGMTVSDLISLKNDLESGAKITIITEEGEEMLIDAVQVDEKLIKKGVDKNILERREHLSEERMFAYLSSMVQKENTILNYLDDISKEIGLVKRLIKSDKKVFDVLYDVKESRKEKRGILYEYKDIIDPQNLYEKAKDCVFNEMEMANACEIANTIANDRALMKNKEVQAFVEKYNPLFSKIKKKKQTTTTMQK